MLLLLLLSSLFERQFKVQKSGTQANQGPFWEEHNGKDQLSIALRNCNGSYLRDGQWEIVWHAKRSVNDDDDDQLFVCFVWSIDSDRRHQWGPFDKVIQMLRWEEPGNSGKFVWFCWKEFRVSLTFRGFWIDEFCWCRRMLHATYLWCSLAWITKEIFGDDYSAIA